MFRGTITLRLHLSKDHLKNYKKFHVQGHIDFMPIPKQHNLNNHKNLQTQ